VSQIATHTLSIAGTAPTFAAAAAGDTAECGSGVFLVVKNTDAAPMTVTVATPGTLETGDAYPDKQYTVAATNGERWIPMLPLYRDPTDRLAHLTYSATTNVTRAVVKAV
jgi:hypothetical protein